MQPCPRPVSAETVMLDTQGTELEGTCVYAWAGKVLTARSDLALVMRVALERLQAGEKFMYTPVKVQSAAP